ncbi:AraC family transcriptional regulator [Pedobacter ginsengisoli]|uniref:AraC family transcriptional regulator n=1 Tax=Pedobacter ginsengisoli TaxID=363852 RepID=UPI00254C5B2D|nr:AraC family transcriptional regulator [Pedobacter ginsengisoli]
MMSTGVETLAQFYKRTNQEIPAELLTAGANGSHFNVRQRCYLRKPTPYNRRDYYKICLITGKGVHISNGVSTEINGSAIILSNPAVPCSFEAICERQGGFYCLFNDTFLQNSIRYDVKYQSALFNEHIEPVLHLNQEETERLHRLFVELEGLRDGNYVYKNDMIRSILQVIILETIRIRGLVADPAAHERLISRFFGLLNQQFPVDSPENPLRLLTPAAYADQLNIHVNHLNNVVKRTTGKTTRDIIHERIIAEAKTLLMNTDWDAAEIAYSLGFLYPSHFNKYFKQHTLTTPLLFRHEGRSLQLNV